mmetsp:Transcript_9917/g.22270  ORF Transcript_9917/g.22270 Transcript_9917/m.22270 type:complete len:206 (-) Transcript_9917:745-1362(-)
MNIIHSMILWLLLNQAHVILPKLVHNFFLLFLAPLGLQSTLECRMRPCLCGGNHPLCIFPWTLARFTRGIQLTVRTTHHTLFNGNNLERRRNLLISLNTRKELLLSTIIIGKTHTQSFLFLNQTLFLQLIPRGLEGVPHTRTNIRLAQKIPIGIFAKVDADEPSSGDEFFGTRFQDGCPICCSLFLFGNGQLGTSCRVHVFTSLH